MDQLDRTSTIQSPMMNWARLRRPFTIQMHRKRLCILRNNHWSAQWSSKQCNSGIPWLCFEERSDIYIRYSMLSVRCSMFFQMVI